MSLFRRSAPELRQWAPEPMIAPFPGATGFPGASATMDSALRSSAVWACVRLLADTVSMMPLKAFTLKGDVRQPTDLPSLFVKPSDDATTSEWIYMTVVSLLLRGNSYGRVVARDTSQYPSLIELLNPDQVKPRWDASTGRLVYAVNGVDVPRESIMHVRAYRMPGSVQGLSPITYAQKAIQTDHAAQEFAHGFFRDGAHPSSVLSTDADMDQEGARKTKDRFRAAVQGREPAVLSGGLKYQAIQVAPNESQFLETRKATVPEIARIFGVPPEMIAGEAGNSMTYANVEQRSLDFLTYSVQPWLTRLESAFSEMMPGKRHVRFDTSVLLRTDMETMYKATAIGLASHQLLPDEARALFDRAPFTDAEKKEADLVPMTVSPSGMPKATPGAAPAGEPAAPAPAPTEVPA